MCKIIMNAENSCICTGFLKSHLYTLKFNIKSSYCCSERGFGIKYFLRLKVLLELKKINIL